MPNPMPSTSRDAKSSSHCPYRTAHAARSRSGVVPPSRIHVSAYCAGSCSSRWTTQPSSPLASSQEPTRSCHSSPRRTSQLPSSCATPPGASTAPTPSTSSRTIASPDRPPSRYSYDGIPGVRGVMTNGGLLTTRSNRSSATGSSIDPSRSSSVTPASAALNRANASARREMSVPTTRRECRDACSAWIPHPVPRSSTCSRGSRTVTCASVVDAPPTPSTWSVRSACPGGQLAEVRRDPPVDLPAPVDGRVRAQVDAGAHLVAVGLDQTEPLRTADGQRRQRPLEQSAVGGDAEQERADQRRDDVVGRRLGRPQRRHGLLAVQRVGGDRPQHLLDPGDAVPRSRQVVAQRRDESGIGQGRTGRDVESHPAIIPAATERPMLADARARGRPPVSGAAPPSQRPDSKRGTSSDAAGRQAARRRWRSTTSGRWSLPTWAGGPDGTRAAPAVRSG